LIKFSATKARGPRRIHKLSLNSPFPPQKQVLTVSGNKKQLIQIILLLQGSLPKSCHSRLIVTGQDYASVKIAPGGVIIRLKDLRTTHVEADTIIEPQAIYAAKEENKNVTVVADDTDAYCCYIIIRLKF